MTHAATAKQQQSINRTSVARPGRRTGSQDRRQSVAQEPLSFMNSARGATSYWTSPESVPGDYPEIEDADVRAWHEAFAIGRQRAAEYVTHVKQHGGRAVSLAWIVGDMPATTLASLSLSVPRGKKEGAAIDSGLVAGFFQGMAELAAGLVGPGDIAWDAVRMDAAAAGKLMPGSTPVDGQAQRAPAGEGTSGVLHSARPMA